MKKIDLETKLGGISAIIAIIAIVAQIAVNGFSSDSVAGGIKDISTTIVALLVLVVAVRKLRPSKNKKDFKELMTDALNEWSERNYPLIMNKEVISKKVNGRDTTLQRYFMLTDHDHLFDYAKDGPAENWKTGLFVEIPEIKKENYISPSIVFHLNESTFMERIKNDRDIKDILKELCNKFSAAILNNFGSILASADKNNIITVKFKNKIDTPEEIKTFVDVIEYVMTLYTIAS